MRVSPRAAVPALLLLGACGLSEADLSSANIEVRGAELAVLGLEPEPEPDPEPVPVQPAAPDGVEEEVVEPDDAGVDAPDDPPVVAEEAVDPPPSDEPLWLDWDLISDFDYEMLDLDAVLAVQKGEPLPDLEERFPTEVIELDGREVEMEGFMIPFEYDDDGIVSFTLVRDQAQCCFGASPQMNHWLQTEMKGDLRSDPFGMDPIFVRGTFHVGEEVEDGYVTSVYRITAVEVEAAW